MVEPAATRKIVLSAVYSKRDTHPEDDALTELYKVEHSDPSARLRPGHYRVLARTAFSPISLQDVGGRIETLPGPVVQEIPPGPVTELTPPVGQFSKRFSVPVGEEGTDRLFSAAQRIRDYLSFASRRAIPLVAILGGKHRDGRELLYPVRFSADAGRSLPPPGTHRTTESVARWYDFVRETYTLTQRFLEELAPGSPLSRAVTLTGEGIWTTDLEERFFYGWRALEVVANEDLRVARAELESGKGDRSQAYFAPHRMAWLSRERVYLETSTMIETSVKHRLPDADVTRFDKYYELRNAIAHGDVSPEQHLEIVREANNIIGFAHACLVHDLKPAFSVPDEPKTEA